MGGWLVPQTTQTNCKPIIGWFNEPIIKLSQDNQFPTLVFNKYRIITLRCFVLVCRSVGTYSRMNPSFMSGADDLEPLYPDDGQRWRHRRLKNYLTCIFMGVICFIAFAVLIAAAGKFGHHSEDPAVIISTTPIVNVSCGFLQGRKEDGVFVFKVWDRCFVWVKKIIQGCAYIQMYFPKALH